MTTDKHDQLPEHLGLLAGAELVDRLTGPDDALYRLMAARLLQEWLDNHTRHLAQLARAQNRSWSDVGDALGVSKQAAQQRYGGR